MECPSLEGHFIDLPSMLGFYLPKEFVAFNCDLSEQQAVLVCHVRPSCEKFLFYDWINGVQLKRYVH